MQQVIGQSTAVYYRGRRALSLNLPELLELLLCFFLSLPSIEVLGALVSILGIWLLTAWLVVVAISRIYSQDFKLEVDVMMSIAAIGIGINIM